MSPYTIQRNSHGKLGTVKLEVTVKVLSALILVILELFGTETASYVTTKEYKVTVERKLLCVKEQIEYHKYVLMSDCFDEEEKKKAKKDLGYLMLKFKELTK